METHGMLPERIPITMAAHDCTNPASPPSVIYIYIYVQSQQ
jgi:hypothetical protein